MLSTTDNFFPLIFLEKCLINTLIYIARFFRIVRKCYNLDGPDSELMHVILIKDSLFRFLCDIFSFIRDGDNLGKLGLVFKMFQICFYFWPKIHVCWTLSHNMFFSLNTGTTSLQKTVYVLCYVIRLFTRWKKFNLFCLEVLSSSDVFPLRLVYL